MNFDTFSLSSALCVYFAWKQRQIDKMTCTATLRETGAYCEKDTYVAGDGRSEVGEGWTASPCLLEVIVYIFAGARCRRK